jgi:hypothetical protein
MTRVAALPGKTWIIIVIPYKVMDANNRKLNVCFIWFVSANEDHSKAHSLNIFSQEEICQH